MKSARTRKRPQVWVVKVGSSVVRDGGLLLMREWMRQVALLKSEHGIAVVWVTSGAIASGAEILEFKKPAPRRTLSEKQALSAVGQIRVVDQYNLALNAHGMQGAQVLLTAADLARGTTRRNFVSTLRTLLAWGVVPVLNENDAVATEEIKFGDNDHLSAQVAVAIGASRLVILMDVGGLHETRHPGSPIVRELSGARLRSAVKQAPRGASDLGTGGILSKLQAGLIVSHAAIPLRLARADLPNVLLKVAEGANTGTEIR